MTTHLFVGPTLSPAETAQLGDFICLPPAAQGDVLRSARARPRVIGIIDGYFDGVPAVWHKEILWAMTQGIHVFGSASMGALRAAELHQYGMRGVGRIFEAYRTGELEDDDEVAVMHGPAEIGYVSLSEPLVNIRATLEQAERSGVISPATRTAWIERAKAMFYPDRTWESLLADGAAFGDRAGEAQRLRDWLPTGRIDRKRLDAEEMISAMRELLATDPAPLQAGFKFEWTDMWDAVAQSATTAAFKANAIERSQDEWVLDELRLDAAAFESVRLRALLRRSAGGDGRSRHLPIDRVRRAETEQRLRIRLGLLRRSDVEDWCAQNDSGLADFERLIDDEARLDSLTSRLDPDLGRDLLDQLRLDGDYARRAARARDKRMTLARRGQEDAVPADVGLPPIGLVAWHFQQRLRRAIPDDLEAHARGLGLAGLANFYRLLLREWLYSQQGTG